MFYEQSHHVHFVYYCARETSINHIDPRQRDAHAQAPASASIACSRRAIHLLGCCAGAEATVRVRRSYARGSHKAPVDRPRASQTHICGGQRRKRRGRHCRGHGEMERASGWAGIWEGWAAVCLGSPQKAPRIRSKATVDDNAAHLATQDARAHKIR